MTIKSRDNTNNIDYIANITSVAPLVTENIVCDTGASNTYFKPNHTMFLQNYKKLKNGPHAFLPNNHKIKASHEGIYNPHKNYN